MGEVKYTKGLLDSIGRNNRKIPDKNCEVCGILFRPIDSKKRCCSRACGYKIRKSLPHNKDKGVGWIDPRGYIQIRIGGKCVRQHRHVMEVFLGRKLDPKEDVHHINGIKTDNRVENLQVINHADHTRITNNREYKKGYKLDLSYDARRARAERMKVNRIKKATS